MVLFGRGLGGRVAATAAWANRARMSSLSYAIGKVFVRVKMRGQHPTVPAFFQVGIAFVAVTVLALVFESPIQLPSTPSAIFAVVWLGVFGSSLAYLIYFRLVHVLGPTRLSMITYLMPIVGIVLGLPGARRGHRRPDDSWGRRSSWPASGLVNSRLGRRKLFGRDPLPVPRRPAA